MKTAAASGRTMLPKMSLLCGTLLSICVSFQSASLIFLRESATAALHGLGRATLGGGVAAKRPISRTNGEIEDWARNACAQADSHILTTPGTTSWLPRDLD